MNDARIKPVATRHDALSPLSAQSRQTRSRLPVRCRPARRGACGVQSAVVHGDKVTLVGFGILEAILAKPRTGRHPRTGQKVDIGEKCPRSSPHRSPPLPVNNARPLKKLCEARSRCQFSLYTGPAP
ncbi:hypothetical protein D8B29_02435 [Verminephrobacter eiseniae]|nr:hypothetical protein [Verminephrobacter eiseniae]MCW5301205.1 hypothetical protein [Verminephrobacter eiseniae]MCW8178529.1 hypothetical protein [Verminephrobacter eiseniae]MCW8189187.1 hypothetical protein [Verminephrobacter eiseniae]